MKKIVHVVGTGTIGEPLIGLFTDFREQLGIDEVTFHKRTPLTTERAKVNHLMARGAKLAVDAERREDFEELGHKVSYEAEEALERATVVIDCTPAGNENKEQSTSTSTGPKGFLAQGSEFGFGKPYARGINDEALVPGEDRFLQIVSCNTHNITTLIKTLCDDGDGDYCARARQLRLHAAGERHLPDRRASSRRPRSASTTTPSSAPTTRATPTTLFETLGQDLDLFSCAVKLNTQYMHSLWFDLRARPRHHQGGGDRAPAATTRGSR